MAIVNNTEALVATGIGNIYRTSDAGEHWSKVFDSAPNTFFFNDLEMLDDSNGFAVGDAPSPSLPPVFVKTSDGGRTWNRISTNLPNGTYSSNRRTDFIDSLRGWAWFNPNIYTTTDGGITWDTLRANTNIDRLFIVNDTIGFFTTLGGKELNKSTDGGKSWIQKKSAATAFEFVCWSPSYSVFYAGGSKFIFRSFDHGETWTQQVLPAEISGGYLYDGIFVNDTTGCITGLNAFFTTENGGMTSILHNEGTLNLNFRLLQNYPNPYNPSTTISFTIPKRSTVSLIVFNILGQKVASIKEGIYEAGNYIQKFDASSLPSGIYFYRLQAAPFVGTQFTETKKMLYIR